jgi:hypothetical protein
LCPSPKSRHGEGRQIPFPACLSTQDSPLVVDLGRA